MGNPWLKKNPFMSMWLSTANRVAGSLRGQATAMAHRQAKAAAAELLSPPAPATVPRPKTKAKPVPKPRPKRAGPR